MAYIISRVRSLRCPFYSTGQFQSLYKRERTSVRLRAFLFIIKCQCGSPAAVIKTMASKDCDCINGKFPLCCIKTSCCDCDSVATLEREHKAFERNCFPEHLSEIKSIVDCIAGVHNIFYLLMSRLQVI